MNCSVAIQYLPMDASSDEETCRIVDEVIGYIASTGVEYFVGPFETVIEGSYDGGTQELSAYWCEGGLYSRYDICQD